MKKQENVSGLQTVTDAAIYEAARKCSTLEEFSRRFPSYRTLSGRRGIYREVTLHLIRAVVQHRYSDGELIASARGFQHKNQWKKARYGHYAAARRRPSVFSTATAHMTAALNPYAGDYCIYAYEFSDSWAYVGLTFNLEARAAGHVRRGPVCEHVKICPNPIIKVVARNLKSPADAVEAEKFWISEYSRNWKMLNSATAGSIGAVSIKVTKDTVIAAAQECCSRKEFLVRYQYCYKTAKRKGWFDEAVAHLPKKVGKRPPVTDAARKAMSESAKRRFSTPCSRAEISARLKGRSLSLEHRQAISAAIKGKSTRPRGWRVTEAEAKALGVPAGRVELSMAAKNALRRYRHEASQRAVFRLVGPQDEV